MPNVIVEGVKYTYLLYLRWNRFSGSCAGPISSDRWPTLSCAVGPLLLGSVIANRWATIILPLDLSHDTAAWGSILQLLVQLINLTRLIHNYTHHIYQPIHVIIDTIIIN